MRFSWRHVISFKSRVRARVPGEIASRPERYSPSGDFRGAVVPDRHTRGEPYFRGTSDVAWEGKRARRTRVRTRRLVTFLRAATRVRKPLGKSQTNGRPYWRTRRTRRRGRAHRIFHGTIRRFCPSNDSRQSFGVQTHAVHTFYRFRSDENDRRQVFFLSRQPFGVFSFFRNIQNACVAPSAFEGR